MSYFLEASEGIDINSEFAIYLFVGQGKIVVIALLENADCLSK